MKKSQIFTVAACGVAALLLTAVLVIGLTGNAFSPQTSGEGPYPHENARTLDPEEDNFSSIDISWLDGPVALSASTDGQVHLIEHSRQKMGEGDQMKVEIKSDTLTVRWDGQWFRRWFNLGLGWLGANHKELEVQLPQELAKSLISLNVGNTSGEVRIAGYAAQEMDVSSVSGMVKLENCTFDESLQAETVSGDMELTGVSGTESMSLSTVSGSMEVSDAYSEKLHLNTVSGAIKFRGDAGEMSASSVSGDVEAALKGCPEKSDLNSVSGKLSLGLPSNAAFTAQHDSVSGNFSCDFTTETLGEDRVRCGNGSSSIYMSTTSGAMSITKYTA